MSKHVVKSFFIKMVGAVVGGGLGTKAKACFRSRGTWEKAELPQTWTSKSQSLGT